MGNGLVGRVWAFIFSLVALALVLNFVVAVLISLLPFFAIVIVALLLIRFGLGQRDRFGDDFFGHW